MAQTNFTPILTYKSDTATAVPSAGNLTNSANGAELAVNTTDKRLFTKNSGGIVVELGTNPSSITLPNATANGVVYANGSKVLTTGSALTFDGTTFATTTRVSATNGYWAGSEAVFGWGAAGTFGNYIVGNTTLNNQIFTVNFAEQMRLTSSGLELKQSQLIGYSSYAGIGTNGLAVAGNVGVGTASPGAKLHIAVASAAVDGTKGVRITNPAGTIAVFECGSVGDSFIGTTSGSDFNIRTGNTVRATFDLAGNLGLGVSPSAWNSSYKAFQIASEGRSLAQTGAGAGDWTMAFNAIYSSANNRWDYAYTGDAAVRYSQTGAGIHAWYTSGSSAGTAGNLVSFSQAMTLDANGNWGLGTTSLSAYANYTTATINGTNGSIIDLKASNVLVGEIFASSGEVNLKTVVSSPLTFGTNNTERARITSDGNLLVGKTSSGIGNVGAENLANGAVFSTLVGSTGATSSYNLYSTGAGAYRFYVGMDGTINATSIVISAISDQRLKENVRDIDVGLDAIMALKPRRFDWKKGKGQNKKNAAGFIAQEFENVFPENVSTSKAGEDGIEYKNINHETLIPALVKAIQEQQTLITALTARITTLESSTLQ